MKRNSFNVLFFIKKAKLLKNGEASVCMRITVNGVRVENNIRKSIEPALWNQAKECAKGKSRKSCDLNAYIEDARIKLHQTFNNNNYNLLCSIWGYRYYEVYTEENTYILISEKCIRNKNEIKKFVEVTDYMGLIINEK